MGKIINAIIVIVTALFMLSCSSTLDNDTPADTSVEYSLPAEWERHEGTWLIWPHDYGIIKPDFIDMIEGIWVTVTKLCTQARESI